MKSLQSNLLLIRLTAMPKTRTSVNHRATAEPLPYTPHAL